MTMRVFICGAGATTGTIMNCVQDVMLRRDDGRTDVLRIHVPSLSLPDQTAPTAYGAVRELMVWSAGGIGEKWCA